MRWPRGVGNIDSNSPLTFQTTSIAVRVISLSLLNPHQTAHLVSLNFLNFQLLCLLVEIWFDWLNLLIPPLFELKFCSHKTVRKLVTDCDLDAVILSRPEKFVFRLILTALGVRFWASCRVILGLSCWVGQVITRLDFSLTVERYWVDKVWGWRAFYLGIVWLLRHGVLL